MLISATGVEGVDQIEQRGWRAVRLDMFETIPTAVWLFGHRTGLGLLPRRRQEAPVVNRQSAPLCPQLPVLCSDRRLYSATDIAEAHDGASDELT